MHKEFTAIVAGNLLPGQKFSFDYALAARDGAKARHESTVVKLWDQEINRLKLDLVQRNEQRRTRNDDGISGHYHD